jgi:hypothetical protein
MFLFRWIWEILKWIWDFLWGEKPDEGRAVKILITASPPVIKNTE